jgi:hypothetical protein
MDDPQEILAELKAWCELEHGRKTKVARYLGVSPQLIHDWFILRKSVPSWKTGMAIQAFLKKSDKARRKSISSY